MEIIFIHIYNHLSIPHNNISEKQQFDTFINKRKRKNITTKIERLANISGINAFQRIFEQLKLK